MKTTNKLKLLVGLALTTTLCLPLQARAVNMQDELARMLNEHPRLKAARSSVKAATWDVERATDSYFPEFSISGQSGPDSYTSDTSTFGQERNLRHTKVTYELRQNLFRGFKDEAVVDASKGEKQISDRTTGKVTQELLLDGASVYIDALRTRELATVIKDKVTLAKDLLALKQRSRESGAITEVDVLEANLAIQRALDEQLRNDAEQRAIKVRYTELFGGKAVPANMEAVSFPASLHPATVEEALQMAVTNNQDVAMARLKMDVARSERKNAFGDYYPTLDLVAQQDYERNLEGQEGTSDQQTVFLQVNWRFNLGNQAGAGVNAAAEKMAVARHDYDNILKQAGQQVRLGYEKYTNLQQRSKLADETLDYATRVLDSRQAQFKAGKVDQTVVIGARARMLSAKYTAITTYYDSIKAGFEYAYAVGNLTPGKIGIK